MRTARIFSLLLVTLALGCNDTRTSGGLIVASEGGSVVADSHEITIPPLSLAADTEVTLEAAPASDYPALAGSLSQVLRIQPEGTVLEIPAEVVIHGSFVGAASDASVAVWQLSNVDGVDRWSPVESVRDSASGDLTVSVTRFAPLGVTVSDAPSGSAISGTLLWGDGTPVDMAPVQLLQGGSLLTTAMTDATGHFAFSDLTAGEYQILIEYECTIDQPVTVVDGMTTELDLTLCGG